MEKLSKELQGFSIKLMILKQLNDKSTYAYNMIRRFTELSEGAIVCEEGYLYPLLKKLTHQGLLTTQWKISDSNQSRKYYDITIKGQVKLKKMSEEIRRLQKWRDA